MKKIIMMLGVLATCVASAGLFDIILPPGEDTRPIGPNGERLNRIPGTLPIEIPQGLTDKQALDAVELAVAGTGAGDKRIHWASQWRMEARDPGEKWIRVGLSAREHYLSVCYRIEDAKLVPDVPTSTNLKQDGIKIHRKVPVWINGLKPLIAAKLYAMSREGVAN